MESIKALEGRKPLVEAIKIVEKVQRELLIEPFATKLKEQLAKKPGFHVMHEVSKVLRGSTDAFTDTFTGFDLELPSMYVNAPIVNVECERCFSFMKIINAPTRLKMTEQHVKNAMVVKRNEDILTIPRS